MSTGIDYGRGITNIDTSNGIRFGVVACNALSPWIWDDLDPVFGPPVCKDCQHEMDYESPDDSGRFSCPECSTLTDEEDAYPHEPVGYEYKSETLVMHTAFDNTELFVTKSTHARCVKFCSPCAPGAGDIDSPDESGVWAYCPPPEWFGECPPTDIVTTEEALEIMKNNPQEHEHGVF